MCDNGSMSFNSLYDHGLIRVAALSSYVTLANPKENADTIAKQVAELAQSHVSVAVFQELCLTGATVDDLGFSTALLDATEDALVKLAHDTADLPTLFVVGAPLRAGQKVYNCAVAIHRGQIIGATPKVTLTPAERRVFASGNECYGLSVMRRGQGELTTIANHIYPVGDLPDTAVSFQFAADALAPISSAGVASLNGANIIGILDATPACAGAIDDRVSQVQALARTIDAVCLYANTGAGESTNEAAWDGLTVIAAPEHFTDFDHEVYLPQDIVYREGVSPGSGADAGTRGSADDVDLGQPSADLNDPDAANLDDPTSATDLNDVDPTSTDLDDPDLSIAGAKDIDLLVVNAVRATNTQINNVDNQYSAYVGQLQGGDEISLRPDGFELGSECDCVQRSPMFDGIIDTMFPDFTEISALQVKALIRRIYSIGDPTIVIGVSGGLDSTQALLVAVKAMETMGRPLTDIKAYTMPGFATSDHTKSNAYRLCEALGVPCQEIDIRPAATQMLADMDHPFARGEEVYDITFENVQAGLRADYLFRLANRHNGFVLGTGDMSELALGWCTYGVGDHMSHYAVNGGMPKTLMQHAVRWAATSGKFGSEVADVLLSILDTEISPELIPPGSSATPQSTQGTIGPYELHDFFLYYMLKGLAPSDIFVRALIAFDPDYNPYRELFGAEADGYDTATIARWLEKFLWRFFTQQFKRTCLANGPQLLPGGSLSPRGGWMMPSDAGPQAWLDDLERAKAALGLEQ